MKKTIFLIGIVFLFLFFGSEILAAKCSPSPTWSSTTCTVDINYTDPCPLGECSKLSQCLYVASSAISPSCPTNGGSWDPACSCSGSSYTCSNVLITIGSGSGNDCYTEGENTCKICSKAVDNAGNVGYCYDPTPEECLYLNIDYTPPTTTISPDGADCVNNNVSFTLSCSDAHSGCQKTEYKIIDSTQTCDTTGLITGTSGTVTCSAGQLCQKKVCYRSTDNAGNVESIKTSNIFKIDTENPYQVSWNPSSRDCANAGTDISVTVQYADDGCGMDNVKYCWTEGASCTPTTFFTNTWGGTATQSGTGNWTLCIEATDVAGNSVTECKGIYKVDKNPPPFPTMNPASRDWANTNVSVTVTYTDDLCGITYTRHCWTPGASCDPGTTAASTFTNGSSVTQTENGEWTLCTRARDGAGNWSGVHCSIQGAYKIDKVNPYQITWIPTSRDCANANTDINVTVEYDDAQSGIAETKYCWAEDTLCTPDTIFTNGGTVSQANTGDWRLCITATDVAGNSITECSTNTYIVDKDLPTAPTRNPDSRGWGNTDVSVTVTYSDNLCGITYTRHCWTPTASCDPGTTEASTFTNGGSVTQTTNGEWTLCTRARDGAGNWSTIHCSASGVYKIDKDPPNVPTRDPNSRDWDITDISVAVTYTDDLSGVQYTRHCWTTTASCDPGTTNASTFTNGGTVTQTEYGAWTLCTRARDVAGNWRGPDCSISGAYKKNAKPTCDSLVGSPNSGYVPLSVIFTGSGNDPDGSIVNYQWDFKGDGVWDETTAESIIGYTYDTTGTYCVKLRVQDNRGVWSDNTGNCPGGVCTQQITVSGDTTAPTVIVEGAPANWQNIDASASIFCSDAESGCDSTTYRLKTYSSNPGSCSTTYTDYTLTSPQTISSNLWLCGAAKDNVGNEGFSSPVEFKIDKDNPQVTAFDVSPKSPNWINNSTPAATISWTVTDLGGSHLKHVEVWRTVDSGGIPDSGQWQQVGSNYTAPADSDSWSSSATDSPSNGTYWYGIHVLDNASNTETEPSPIKVLVDKTNPSSAVTNPTAGSWHNNDFTVTLDDSDTGGSGLAASCQYLIVGLNPDPIGDDCSSGILSRSCDPVTKNVPVGSGSCSISNICIFEGENRCRANTQSFDNAGNSSGWQSRNFSIDYTPPVVGQVSPLTAIKGKETTFSASVSDSVSQILGCYFYEGVSLLSSDVTFSDIPCTECEVSVDYAFDTTGDHENVYFMCWDKAQNIGTGNPVTIRVEPKPTLAVDLSAEPSVGADSLYNVDLTATVSGTMSGTINYKFDCTNDDSWELEINNTDINPYTAIDLCDYPVIGTYTAKVFIQRGESCGTVVECTDEYLASNPVEYCCQEKKVSINVVADQPPICQISVPENGVVNIWIEINVSGSSDPEGVLSNVRFSSDNNLNGSVDGGWNPATGYYDWNSSSGNWNATNKTMKWSFAQTGDYEVWAEVKDDVNQTTACYDTIIITECFPGETKGCTSIQGCNHTLTCQANGTWSSCPIDECTQGTTQSCGVDGTQTCTNVCTWGTCVEPGTCSPTPPSCPICQHPECISDEWTCQPDSVGTDCGDCRLCDGVGYCNYICLGAESSCECISDSCIDCSNYYDGGCNYYSCGSLEKPVWSCSGGNCQYSCQYDAACEGDGDGNGDGNGNGLPLECEREYPDVYLSPSSQSGTAGDQLLYTISVVNNDTNCDTSTFSLTKSCPSGWACSLDTTSLIISPGYSNSTILRVTSPSPPYTKGNYEVSVTATNSGVPEYFHTGYAIYQVGNNPPTAAISCYPSGCSQSSGSCTGYTRSTFCLKNNSYDLDGISDIKKSNWNITGPVSQSSVCISDPLCNWTLPSHFTAGSYSVLLYVEDQAGATSTASKNFTLLQDIIADFECSLVPDEGWTEDCGALKVSVDEVVFFKDTSIPSSGATILDSGYNWTAVDGKFVKPTNKSSKNPQISFKKEDVASGTVILEVTDSAGRSDTVSQKIWLTQPLPEWQEVPPF